MFAALEIDLQLFNGIVQRFGQSVDRCNGKFRHSVPTTTSEIAAAPARIAVAIAGSARFPASSSSSSANESAVLVPEQVPFVSGQEQASTRDGYLPAPSYKALALRAANATGTSTIYAMAFVTGQPSQEAAEASALAACQQKIPDSLSQKKFHPCEIYASGNLIAKGFRSSADAAATLDHPRCID
jgi:hypothetical protein